MSYKSEVFNILDDNIVIEPKLFVKSVKKSKKTVDIVESDDKNLEVDQVKKTRVSKVKSKSDNIIENEDLLEPVKKIRVVKAKVKSEDTDKIQDDTVKKVRVSKAKVKSGKVESDDEEKPKETIKKTRAKKVVDANIDIPKEPVKRKTSKKLDIESVPISEDLKKTVDKPLNNAVLELKDSENVINQSDLGSYNETCLIYNELQKKWSDLCGKIKENEINGMTLRAEMAIILGELHKLGDIPCKTNIKSLDLFGGMDSSSSSKTYIKQTQNKVIENNSSDSDSSDSETESEVEVEEEKKIKSTTVTNKSNNKCLSKVVVSDSEDSDT